MLVKSAENFSESEQIFNDLVSQMIDGFVLGFCADGPAWIDDVIVFFNKTSLSFFFWAALL